MKPKLALASVIDAGLNKANAATATRAASSPGLLGGSTQSVSPELVETTGFSALPKEMQVLDQARERMLRRRLSPSKSELLRVALHLLSATSDDDLEAALQELPPNKKGRRGVGK